MKPIIITEHFEAAWGRKPRGEGYWAFDIGPHIGTVSGHKPFWFNGMYSDAKKAAIKEAKKRDRAVITVLS